MAVMNLIVFDFFSHIVGCLFCHILTAHRYFDLYMTFKKRIQNYKSKLCLKQCKSFQLHACSRNDHSATTLHQEAITYSLDVGSHDHVFGLMSKDEIITSR